MNAQIIAQLTMGFWINIKIFILTLIFSLPLGLIISFGSMSRFTPLRKLIQAFIWVIRGTPLMLQLLVFFYVPGLVFGLPSMDRFTAVIVAFVVNYACYFAVIYEGGIRSIPHGQMEAGQVLGMTRQQIFFKVILLQVVKHILPPMGNEVITLVKDTSLARLIAIYEIIYVGQTFIKKGLAWPLFFTGVFFLVFNGLVTLLLDYLQKKLNYFRG